ncbi:MAG: leucyl/phenylalanyl-tRNA--protein transferase [Deltaproteobacteria bacterium]|nr:leucyl/phenylalanyl-tRNA--protein transferase [Deltaproteobacteria bacterium]
MPIYRLTRDLVFPPVEHAEDGVLAVGGDLRPERLLLAYRQGIFPWYHDGIPILWHSPDPRAVLWTDALRVNRTLRKLLRRRPYLVTVDRAFPAVIRACKEAFRPGQDGTWITDEMEDAYTALHALGHAHSVEAWQGDQLVGGLYGVALGRMYFGESMFSRADSASKVAAIGLVQLLRAWEYPVVDCQVLNEHTRGLGAVEVTRREYLRIIGRQLQLPGHPPPWTAEPFAPEAPASAAE